MVGRFKRPHIIKERQQIRDLFRSFSGDLLFSGDPPDLGIGVMYLKFRENHPAHDED